MKLYKRNCVSQLAAWLAFACLLLAIRATAMDVIDPTGLSYAGVSDSSEYSSSYAAANLFDLNVTSIPVGTILSGDAEYATAGQSNCFVAFQLDENYTNVASIFYAQRAGSDPALDKINVISIWASDSIPFAAADPGTPPDSVIAITNLTGAQWTEYLMTNTIAGQYFLVDLQQTTPGGNPGGHELRLGAALGIPPQIAQAPMDKMVYEGGTARFSASVGGTIPLVYSWSHGNSTLSNGGRISGADTGNLIISGIIPTDAGDYTLNISNSYGTTNATANLAVVPVPADAGAAETAVISKNPYAFWQLNEAYGSPVALDLMGSFDGAYGLDSGAGVAGPQTPAYPGFSATNTAVQTYAYDLDSTVTVPPLNISTTNSVTILAWIYQDDSAGPQQPYTGIVYCRGGGTSAGLICSSDGTQLGYQWQGTRYFFNSGLVIPINQWTLVAMVYTTNFTTLYCGTTNGIVLSAVDNFAQGGQSFAAPMMIGIDTDVGESTRTFNGVIDDVAFFNRALSGSEINDIYSAGTGINPQLQILSQTTTNLTVFQGERIDLMVQVSGLNPVYQWYKQNTPTDTPVAGATNSSFTVSSSAQVGDAGNYYVVVSNQIDSVTSDVISVTVPSYLVRPIGPSGAIYTGLSSSSDYDPSYAGTNMFDTDVTSISLGTHLTGNDWAAVGTDPEYLAFQVDQSYPVNAIFYAQRNGSDPGLDKITQISIWASQTTPFGAYDPGTTPDAVIPITNTGGAMWERYILPATVSGQYFVIKIEQTPTAGGNIGGNEFRLGAYVTPVPLTYSYSPAGLTLNWPASATLQQAGDITGPWVTATGVTSGVPIPATAGRQFYRILY